MDWWVALNYGMTGIATGGFGITDNSMGDFGTGPRLVMVMVMLAGATSFAIHYRVLAKGDISSLWKDGTQRLLFGLLACGTLIVGLENYWFGAAPLWLDALFQWTSALTTSGFSTTDLGVWPAANHVLLVIAMVCGGTAGATTGGIKLKRVLVLAVAVFVRLRGVAVHPWRLMEHRALADENARAEQTRLVEAASIMLLLWFASIFLGSLLLLHAAPPGVSLNAVMLEATSALSNVGLSAGITGPELSTAGKLGLMVLMWLGRLEIVPVLVLFTALVISVRIRISGERDK
jgi:trk system potassium uptake protein TrkH